MLLFWRKKDYLRGLFPQNEVVATHDVLLLTNCVVSFVGPALFVGKHKHCITQEVVADGVFVSKLKNVEESVQSMSPCKKNTLKNQYNHVEKSDE